MPFLGQDWRSPGDQWVRTSEGWERLRLWRLKVFENLNENVVARLIRLALTMDVGPHRQTTKRRQPYFFFNRGTSRERKELTSLSEALLRLDMAGAVKDIRRSNFVCKLLQLIFESKLPNLSGTAQKHIFQILEATVKEALRTELNIGLAKKLLVQANRALEKGQIFHIGSNCLWARHTTLVCNLNNQVSAYQIKQRKEDNGLKLSDLPDDCLRSILYRIADHSDVVNAGQTTRSLQYISDDVLLWQKMCYFHFTQRQLLTFLPSNMATGADEKENQVDWKYLYRRCYKRFGKKDTFADMLAMCSNCCSIFWQSLGHPCIRDNEKRERTLTPEDFIKLFPL
ncbi:F-box only protein 25-like [Babylonia areolata]|uniref:F-box only protein 25-like n=1 Tax=Babylonia areolata TaxID=304850 RepID=UPI003FD3014A